MICNICKEGHDPSAFPLAARFDNNQQISYLCLDPTPKYKDSEGNWKKCVMQFINPVTPETVDTRDLEGGTTHTKPTADVKTYNPEEKQE